MEKVQYRSVICFLLLEEKTCEDKKVKMDAVYGDLSLFMTTVKYCFNEFTLCCISVFDEERPGRLSVVVTEEIIEKVHMIHTDRRSSRGHMFCQREQ